MRRPAPKVAGQERKRKATVLMYLEDEIKKYEIASPNQIK